MSEDADEVLSRRWAVWLSENLLRGVPRERLISQLVDKGVPRVLAASTTDALMASPVFEAAYRQIRRASRAEKVLELRRELRQNEIERVSGTPTEEEFRSRYVNTNTPLVFVDLIAGWPATEKWTPAYFAEAYGHVEVSINSGRTISDAAIHDVEEHSERMKLARFIDYMTTSTGNDKYVVARNHSLSEPQLRPLFRDLRLNETFLGGAPASSALWLGPAGTRTPLHHDVFNILFFQFFGTKKFELIGPERLDLFDDAESTFASPRWRDLPNLSPWSIELSPGEALFIPVGWWHETTALSASISVGCSDLKGDATFEWYLPGAIR